MKRGYVDNISDYPYPLYQEEEQYNYESHNQYEYLKNIHPSLRGQYLRQQQMEKLDLASDYYSDDEGDDDYDS